MTETSQQATDNQGSIPKWFTIAATLALLWNVTGIIAFVGQVTMTPAMMAELPPAEQTLYASIPLWANIAFACAVFGGALGSLALLMKKSIAQPLLLLSLAGVVVQMFHAFVINNAFEVLGPSGAVMPIMVLIIAIALVRLVSTAKTNNWLI